MNNELNEKCTVKPDVIFETLILADTDRAHITLQQPVFPHKPQSQVPITRRPTQTAILQSKS